MHAVLLFIYLIAALPTHEHLSIAFVSLRRCFRSARILMAKRGQSKDSKAVKYICFDHSFEIKKATNSSSKSYTIFGEMAILLSLYGLLQFIILIFVSLTPPLLAPLATLGHFSFETQSALNRSHIDSGTTGESIVNL